MTPISRFKAEVAAAFVNKVFVLHCYAPASHESLFLVANCILDSNLTQRCPSARVVAHCMSVQDKDKADKDFYRCLPPPFSRPFFFAQTRFLSPRPTRSHPTCHAKLPSAPHTDMYKYAMLHKLTFL